MQDLSIGLQQEMGHFVQCDPEEATSHHRSRALSCEGTTTDAGRQDGSTTTDAGRQDGKEGSPRSRETIGYKVPAVQSSSLSPSFLSPTHSLTHTHTPYHLYLLL